MTKREALTKMCLFDGWTLTEINGLFRYLGEAYLNEPIVTFGSSLGCVMRGYRIFVLGETN
jgi:hypothetical protein